MKERNKFITEDTKINIDESAFEARAKELVCELFVEYVNNSYQSTVLELK